MASSHVCPQSITTYTFNDTYIKLNDIWEQIMISLIAIKV